MKIELLWFEDCPNHVAAEEMLANILAEFGLVIRLTGSRFLTSKQASVYYFQAHPPSVLMASMSNQDRSHPRSAPPGADFT